MPARDISRHLFQPDKHYSSVRMQQGRVILDSDWNETESIDDEEARRNLLDIIGVRGAPDSGFLVRADGALSPDAPVDFDIGEGSFYAGGLRFSADDGARYLTQNDWLRVDVPDGELPRVPGPTEARTDFVYLRGWEQPVSAVEDAELQETALGGPDTSVRMRRMARVEVVTSSSDTCPAAFAELIDRERAIAGSDAQNEFDADQSELRSAARLSVTFTGNGRTDNLCSPNVTDGFLGAENETLRVQLTQPGRFIWGRDNASPLYRVRVHAEATGEEPPANTSIEFLNLPKDELAQPLQGHAVEILPWTAQLPNGEHVAAATGHLATVSASYNPNTRRLSIARPVPRAWLDRQRELAGPDADVYLYLRLWTGGSGDATKPGHEVAVGEDIELGETGLSVRFSSFGRPGDHWIIAARPSTPAKVVPWQLMDSAPPSGPREFLAPLALLTWRAGDDGVIADVTDCRPRFRPLTAQGGRCSVMVGDGITSKGHLTSIQDAIDLLPADGGKVCLLSGTFAQSFEIRGRRNIIIEGNGVLTRVVGPPDARGYDGSSTAPLAAVARIVDSESIRLQGFAIATEGIFGVELSGPKLRDVRLRDLDLFALGSGTRARPTVMPAAAIHGLGGRHISIEGCRVRMADLPSPFPAVYVEGTDIAVRDNLVLAGAHPDDAKPGRLILDPVFAEDRVWVNLTVMRRALDLGRLPVADRPPVAAVDALDIPNIAPFGGVQIGGNSSRVLIAGNDILGGSGHGITLGSVSYLRSAPPIEIDPDLVATDRLRAFAATATTVRVPIGHNGGAFFAATFRLSLIPSALQLPGSNAELTPMSSGSLSSITIRDNRITNHGGSGISTASFSGEPLLPTEGGRSLIGPDLRLVAELRPATLRAAGRLSSGATVAARARLDAGEVIDPTTPTDPAGPSRPSVGEVPGEVVVAPVSDAGRAGDVGAAAGVGGIGIITVADITICDNEIADNNRLVARAGANVVHGGIGLEVGIDVAIRGNNIVENGWGTSGAVAGIGILTGANITILGNEIVRTGSVARIRPVSIADTFVIARAATPVLQGGIVLGPIVASGNQDRDGIPSSGGTAIRIQNNQVDQPFGKALWIHGALGPVKVEGNSLVAREDRARVPASDGVRFGFDNGPELLATGSCVQISCMAADPDDTEITQLGGELVFHDNLVSLERGGPIGALLLSWDEVSAQGNQFRSSGAVLFNTIAFAQRVVQVCNNRFREPDNAQTAAAISLLAVSRSSAAVATGNAARHCLLLSAEQQIAMGNHVEASEACSNLGVEATTRDNILIYRVQ